MRAVSIKILILISLGHNFSDSGMNISDYLVTASFPHIFLLFLSLNCGEMLCVNSVKCITMPLELI